MAVAVNYLIYLTDPAKVASLQTQFPTGVQIPPAAAAAAYGVPFNVPGGFNLGAVGGITINPSDSVGYGVDLSPSYGTETFSVTFTSVNPPPAIFGNPYPITIACYWNGIFAYTGGVGTTAPPNKVPRYLGARRWAVGFEAPTLGDGGSGSGTHVSRDSSRTPDGMGFCYRGNANQQRTVTMPSGKKISWERFYLRLRKLPVGGDDNIWAANGSGEAGASFLLNVNTTGTLQGYMKGNAAYPGTSAGTSTALTLNTWYKIDIRLEYITPISPATSAGRLTVYVNGTQAFDATNAGIAASQTHSSSSVGADVSSTSDGLECDIDDWISANEVTITDGSGAHTYPGMDLTSGSHVVLVRPTGFGTGHATSSWNGVGAGAAGNFRCVNNNPADPTGASAGLTSTTVSAKIVVTTDYQNQQWGCACVTVGAFPYQAGLGNGALLVNALSSTQVFAASTWSAALALYTVADGTTVDTLPDISPMTLGFTSGTAAGTTTVTGLFGLAEMIGEFGAEDAPPANTLTFPPRPGIHNQCYPKLMINQDTNGPLQAVRVCSGVYVGNNIGQDVLAQMPAHWYWVRPLANSNGGIIWWSSMTAAHGQLPKGFQPEYMNEATLNNNVPQLQVNGSNAIANATGSFQWVTVSDIGMRFLLNQAFAHKSSLASAANTLIDAGFTPDCAFFVQEDFTSAATGMWFKGPGHTTDTASKLDSASSSAILTLAAGSITSQTTIHTDTPQTAYSLWRKADGSGVAQWFDVVTYTGNGAGGTRNIAVSINGTSPLFCLVVPHNGAAYFRDPSHTGLNSNPINGGASTTGITAGAANQVTVGTSLNANNIVYELFVVGGATTSGWSPNPGPGTPPGGPIPNFPPTALPTQPPAGGGGNPTAPPIVITYPTPYTPFTVAPEVKRTGGPWTADPIVATYSAVTINSSLASTAGQWRVQRIDLEPSKQESA